MVRALAGKEFREALRSVRFLAVVLVSCTLIPISAFVNTRSYEHRVRYHEELVQVYKTQTETAGLRADLVAEAFRPPSVLGILCRGIEPALPSRIQTSRDGLFMVLSENQPADPAPVSADSTDLLFLTTIVLSLLAFVFVHGMVTREKEEGTLRLLVSTGAPRGSILSGKLLGSYFAFALPVAVGLIVVLGIMVSSPTVRAHLDGQALPILLVLVSALALLFLLFLLATFVSMFAHRAGVAIVLLLFLWVFLVLALPRMAPMVAQIIYPSKPHHVVEMEKRLFKTSGDIRFRESADSLYRGILSRHGVDADTLGMVAPQLLAGELKAAHDEYEKALTKLETSHLAAIQAQWRSLDSACERAYRSQRLLASSITRLSPAGAFSLLAITLAGTGPNEWDRSLTFARDFQDRVTRELYDRWIVRPYGANRSVTVRANGTRTPRVDKDRLLAILGPPPTSERLKEAVPDMLILGGMTLLAGAGCWFKFRSYDVR
jgi:ABC-2 type transport system permease protein